MTYDRYAQLGVLASSACGSGALNTAVVLPRQQRDACVKGVLSSISIEPDEGPPSSEPRKLQWR